jgi:hypothetical protein
LSARSATRRPAAKFATSKLLATTRSRPQRRSTHRPIELGTSGAARLPPSTSRNPVDTTRRCAQSSSPGLIHPLPAPYGDGERIDLLSHAFAIGERVGNAGSDLFRSPMKEVLSCAISAMRRQWRVPCAKP